MSVLIYIDHADGHVKKTSLEAVCYGVSVAAQLNVPAEGLLLGTITDDPASLGKYGLKKIHHAANDQFNALDSKMAARITAEIVSKTGAQVVVFSNNLSGKAIAPRLSARLKAGLVAGAVALPETGNGFTVKKNVFSGKAFATISVTTPVKIITVNPNAFQVKETGGTATVENVNTDAGAPSVKVTAVNKVKGEIPLSEAERVVSGGRGLKGPENWGMLEELAKLLEAGTACSRAVADAHWRPHHEHVGQTGLAIAPNLYLAVGISGAIQHLAGVNRSKVIVVINKDPEAPFFKAADYGIVGDAFEVIPKMIEAVKKMKGR